jgi:hypothetical protein
LTVSPYRFNHRLMIYCANRTEFQVPYFRIVFSMSSDDPPRSVRFDVADETNEAELLNLAKSVIAEELGHTGALVMFMPATGRFTIGAGFWSRRGVYHIESEPGLPPLPGASLAGNV